MIRDYEFSWLSKDLAAGITLGMVMVPVGLAFGEFAVADQLRKGTQRGGL